MKSFFAAIAFAIACCAGQAALASADIYGRLPGLESVDLSPRGTRYAFIATIGAQRRIVVMNNEDKLVFQSPLSNWKVRGVRWASEDHLMIEISDTQNLMATFGITMEIWNVLWINLKTNKAGFVFNDEAGIADAVFGTYGTAQIGDKAYGYFGGIPLARATGNRTQYTWDPGAGVDLFRVDLDNGAARSEARSVPGGDHDWVVGADGKVAATAIYFTKDGLWRLHSGEGLNKALREEKAPIRELSLTGLGRAPGTFLVSDWTGEQDELQEVNAATGERERLLKEHSVEKLLFDPVTHLLIGAQIAGNPGAMFFDPAIDARWRGLQKTFPGFNLHLVSWDHNFEKAVVMTDGQQDSGTFWKVEMATGTTKVLGKAYPMIPPPRVGATRMVKYKAADGLDLEGVLTLPAKSDGKNLPVVVMPHGGPIGPFDGTGFDWWAQAYADAGYAVFQPNYRGSGGYGAAFREAGFGEWGGKMLSDISDGLKALADTGTVDPKRACIVGASYGGYAALAGVTVQQGLYRCAISVSGVSNMRNFFDWIVNRSGRQTSTARFFKAAIGAVSRNEKVMTEISPATYAARADAPVLLMHGEDDTVVPIAQSGLMASALESAGKPVEFMRMKGEDHWLSSEGTRIEMLTQALAFVKKHNPPN